MTEEEITIENIENTIKKYKKQEETKKQKGDQPVTINDLATLLSKINQKQNKANEQNTQNIEQTPQKTEQKPMKTDERKQIAWQLYKDSKSMLLVCLIAMIMPLIIIFISMIEPMAAIIAAMLTLFYPAIIFVKMIGLQTQLHKKYGWKPMLMMPQQQQNPNQYPPQPTRNIPPNKRQNQGGFI